MSVLNRSDPHHAHAIRRLDEELVLWLTTVTVEGQPQPSPVWFLAEGEVLWIWSMPGAPKVRNLRANPRVSIALRTDEGGDDVVTFEGLAELPEGPRLDAVAAYVGKYDHEARRLDLAWPRLAEDYRQPIRVSLTRVRVDLVTD
ncbi:MAG TPA: nitroreductase/quinone reductase family protein [Actinomycetota bacterium]|nr:nitroreductase/quinone reductase family protein [Actinomycetota bacterium]